MAQGTDWAVAVTQAFFVRGSIPTACRSCLARGNLAALLPWQLCTLGGIQPCCARRESNRVTSMGGLYDAATLRALCFHCNVCHIMHFCYDLPARALVGGSRATSRGYIQCICLGWTSRCTASIRGGKEKMLCQDAMLICYANMIC